MNHESGSVDGLMLWISASIALLGWYGYQQNMLKRDQQRFDAFTEKVPLVGVKFSDTVWPLPLPPRTDYGVQSHRLYSIAECALRHELQAPEEGLPACP